MAPDLNSLPTSAVVQPSSPRPLQRPRRISFTTTTSNNSNNSNNNNNNNNNNATTSTSTSTPPSPRSPSLSSLQAAAAINAGLHRSPERAERRRSSLMNNFLLNDPTLPSPGELQPGTPRLGHHRQPSLGELHQELENEQEAQVNRLLHMIRLQQDQLAAIQRQQQQQQQPQPQPQPPPPPPLDAHACEPAAGGYPTPPLSSSAAMTSAASSPRLSFNSRSRQSSTTRSPAVAGSHANSPSSMRPISSGGGGPLAPLNQDFLLIGGGGEHMGTTRDECAFYQAETHSLTRENQMLKQRIRELERQISDMSSSAAPLHPAPHHSVSSGNLLGPVWSHSSQSYSPTHVSPLASPPASARDDPPPAVEDG